MNPIGIDLFIYIKLNITVYDVINNAEIRYRNIDLFEN